MGQLSARLAAPVGAFGGIVVDKEARPIGPKVVFDGAGMPDGRTLVGRYVTLEKLDPARHGAALWDQMDGQDRLWDYLFEAPPETEAAFVEILAAATRKDGWLGYAICLPDVGAVGYAFYLNIVPALGTIEVGNINFSPRLQRTPAATEAMALMMHDVFALGYRRYEWKCNALNMPSRRAAQRLGFSWEGIFRQHMVVKGHNRDTAWFAMTDTDWSGLQAAFKTWLSPENFDADGYQRQSLRALTAPHRAAGDPAQSEG